MGKRLIIIGADFSENCIPVGPQPSGNMITMALTDGHQTAIYQSQNGGALALNSTGYGGWAQELVSDISGYTKISGKTTYYDKNNLLLPSIVFLDSQDAVLSYYSPVGTPINGNSSTGYVGEFTDTAIPSGATKLYVQCFTGGSGQYITDQALYLVP